MRIAPCGCRMVWHPICGSWLVRHVLHCATIVSQLREG